MHILPIYADAMGIIIYLSTILENHFCKPRESRDSYLWCDFFYPMEDTSLFERLREEEDTKIIEASPVALVGFVTLLVCFILHSFFLSCPLYFLLTFYNYIQQIFRWFFGSTRSRAMAKRKMRGVYIRDRHRYDRINKFAVLWSFSHRSYTLYGKYDETKMSSERVEDLAGSKTSRKSKHEVCTSRNMI